MLSQQDLDHVDELKDSIEANEKPDMESKEWEKLFMGVSRLHRVSNKGRAEIDYQASLIRNDDPNMPEMKEKPISDKKKVLFHYFSKLGADVLSMQLVEEEEKQREFAKMKKNAKKATSILRRRVKVADADEDDEALRIDQEWDTSNWKNEQIEAGLDYLFYIFVDDRYSRDPTMKARASTMIDKLLTRHHEAQTYLEFKLETLVGRAISRFVRNGVSLAQQDFLYILHVGRYKFLKDLSGFNFAGRALEMANIEGRLASIVIQHCFRTFYQRRNRVTRKVNPITKTFGKDFEMKALQESSVTARTKDLKDLWHNMHCLQGPAQRGTPVGCRGPVHINNAYMIMILEIVLALVEPKAGPVAHANREDVISSNGGILLGCFLSYVMTDYNILSLSILSNCSKVASNMERMLQCGIVKSTRLLLKFLRETSKLEWLLTGKTKFNKPRHLISEDEYQESQKYKRAFFDAIMMLRRLAVHASGLYRAAYREGAYYTTAASKGADSESVDYKVELQHLRYPRRVGDLVRSSLGNPMMMKYLTKLTLECKHLHAMRILLEYWYALACSDAHGCVLFEFVGGAGELLKFILKFIEEEDLTIATLALCIFIQLCTIEDGRETIMHTWMTEVLSQYTPVSSNYERLPYLRAIMINVSLLRQHDLRYYEPEQTPHLFRDKAHIKMSIYLDVLKALKQPENNISDTLSIADLTVMPGSATIRKDFSQQAELIGARDVANFFLHPGDYQFLDHLDWDLAVAGCEVLEGLCETPGAAEYVFSEHSLFYCGRYIFITRWMFAGPAMNEQKIIMCLNGVRSAAQAISRLCLAVFDHPEKEAELLSGLLKAEVIEPVEYFISNLSMDQKELSPAVLLLQRSACQAVLNFAKHFCRIYLKILPNNMKIDAVLDDITPIGMATLKVIKRLNTLYRNDNSLLTALLESTCAVIEQIAVSDRGAKYVANDWESGKALEQHLPPPLSGVGPKGVEEENYKVGLMRMAPSFFRFLANLCQTESGQGDALSLGFLRRALDKFTILYPVLVTHIEAGRNYAINLARRDAPELATEHKGDVDANLPYLAQIQANDAAVADASEAGAPHPSADPTVHRRGSDGTVGSIMPALSEEEAYEMLECESCLVLISKVINYTSYKHGSANDLILLDHYDFIRKCQRIVSRVGKEKWNSFMDTALQCLANLSQDNTRLVHFFEEIDLMGTVQTLLTHINGSVSERAMKCCCTIIQYCASTLRTKYLGMSLPYITEPLAKVQCVYPSLLEDVRTASWSAMKFALDVEKEEKKAKYAEKARIAELEGTSIASSVVAWQHKAFDINTDNILHQRLKEVYISSGFSKQEVEEMDRINQAVMNDDDNHDRDLPLDAVHGGGMMEMSQLSLEESVASTMGPESPDRPSGGQTADNAIKSFDRAVLYRNANKRSIQQELQSLPITLDKTGILSEEDVRRENAGDIDGTEMYCGPSECGSLSLEEKHTHGPGSPSQGVHGNFSPIKKPQGPTVVTAHSDHELQMMPLTSPVKSHSTKGGHTKRNASGGMSKKTPSLATPSNLSPMPREYKRLKGKEITMKHKRLNTTDPSKGLYSPLKLPNVKETNTKDRVQTSTNSTRNSRKGKTDKMSRSKSVGLLSHQDHHQESKSPGHFPQIIELDEAPEFMETRPPVDKSQVFFC